MAIEVSSCIDVKIDSDNISFEFGDRSGDSYF